MSYNPNDNKAPQCYLTGAKLDLIDKYLEDQIKLVTTAPCSPPLYTPETASSPATTPNVEPKSDNSRKNQNVAPNSYSEIYRTFALPMYYNIDSTEDRSISQKSQGLGLADRDVSHFPPIKEAILNCPHNQKRDLKLPKPLSNDNSPQGSNRINPNSDHPLSILNSFYHDQTNQIPSKHSLGLKDMEEPKIKAQKSSRQKAQNRHPKIPQFISSKLSNHRILLPKLERAKPSEIIRKNFNRFHFSEKEFLGLTKSQRKQKIHKLLNEETNKDILSIKSRFKTSKKPKFFKKNSLSQNDEVIGDEAKANAIENKANQGQYLIYLDLKSKKSNNKEKGKKRKVKPTAQNTLGSTSLLSIQKDPSFTCLFGPEKEANFLFNFDKDKYIIPFRQNFDRWSNCNNLAHRMEREINKNLTIQNSYQNNLHETALHGLYQPSKDILGNSLELRNIWK